MTDQEKQAKARPDPATARRAALGSLGARQRLEMDEAEAALAQAASQEKE